MNKIICKWHQKLDMPKHDIAWHKQDIDDELLELEEAKGFLSRWSEYSDVCYTYTRALWSGHISIKRPIKYHLYIYGLIYMFPKFTLRWRFFDQLGKQLGNVKIREVRNPSKIKKIEKLALKYNIDEEIFVKEAKTLLERRFFLK